MATLYYVQNAIKTATSRHVPATPFDTAFRDDIEIEAESLAEAEDIADQLQMAHEAAYLRAGANKTDYMNCPIYHVEY